MHMKCTLSCRFNKWDLCLFKLGYENSSIVLFVSYCQIDRDVVINNFIHFYSVDCIIFRPVLEILRQLGTINEEAILITNVCYICLFELFRVCTLKTDLKTYLLLFQLKQNVFKILLQ